MHTCVLSQLTKRVFIDPPASTANLDREIKQNDSAPASLELLLSDEVKLKLFADLFGHTGNNLCLHTAIVFSCHPFDKSPSQDLVPSSATCKQRLDLAVEYLRQVHSVCFYSGKRYLDMVCYFCLWFDRVGTIFLC